MLQCFNASDSRTLTVSRAVRHLDVEAAAVHVVAHDLLLHGARAHEREVPPWRRRRFQPAVRLDHHLGFREMLASHLYVFARHTVASLIQLARSAERLLCERKICVQ